MSSVGHLPVHFTSIDECPEPFRDPLKGLLIPPIIFTISFTAPPS